MKRLAAILLAVCLLLCACGKAEEISATTTEATTQATTEATTEPTTEATTEATEPIVLYRHPLTGEPLDAPYTLRPTAVVINNLKYAMPQYGIGQADIIYELIAEGDITRLLAVFTDMSDVGSIGPVRSVRTFFSNIAVAYDAPIVHCGGSRAALNAQYDDTGDTINNWEHIDEMYNGSYFFRDYSRFNSGYSWEHCLFTNGEKLIAALESKGFNTPVEADHNYGMTFADEIDLNGEKAETVIVNFKGGKTTTMTYDAETGLYSAAQYGTNHIDANTGETLQYRNVVVLYTNQRGAYDGHYTRSYYDLVGSGEGHFACNGEIVPIKWERSGLREPFTYTLADGTPLAFGVGKTYVGIVSTSCTTTYE